MYGYIPATDACCLCNTTSLLEFSRNQSAGRGGCPLEHRETQGRLARPNRHCGALAEYLVGKSISTFDVAHGRDGEEELK